MSAPLERSTRWMIAGLLAIAGAAALRSAAAGTLRVDEVEIAGASQVIVAVLSAFGCSALCGGYLAGLAALSGGTSPRPSWRWLVSVAVVLQVIAALAIPLTSNDVFNYLLWGHLEAFGGVHAATASPEVLLADPLHLWVGRAWGAFPCVYGPVLIAYFRLISMLSGGTMVAGLIAHKLTMLFASVAWVGLAAAWTRSWGPETSRPALFWLLACNPVWLTEIAGQAHNDGLVVLLVMLAVFAWRRGRQATTVALLAVATSAKYFAIVPFGMLMLWGILRPKDARWTRCRRVLASASVFVAVVVACYAPTWDGWITISYPWSFLTAPQFVGSLLHVAYAAGWLWGPETMLAVASGVGGVFAVLLAVLTLGWIWGWRADPDDGWRPWETSFRFVLLYLVLLTGFFLPWYLTWMLPLVAVVHDRRWWAVVAVYGCSAILYFGWDPLFDLALPAFVSQALRPVLSQGPALIALLRMAGGRSPVPARLWRPGRIYVRRVQ
ncbi:MAG: hypothetical protein WCP29_14325 [Acidobacteriota bacterium]